MSDLIQLYANANIRIGEVERENAALKAKLHGILETVTNDKMSDKAKVLDIQFVLRKEPQP